MIRFRGTVRGRTGRIRSRVHTTESGLTVDVRGRNDGMKVVATVDDEGNDHFSIFMTGGTVPDKLIGTVHSAPWVEGTWDESTDADADDDPD